MTTALKTLKIAVFIPIATASVKTTTAVKRRFRRMVRSAKRTSCSTCFVIIIVRG